MITYVHMHRRRGAQWVMGGAETLPASRRRRLGTTTLEVSRRYDYARSASSSTPLSNLLEQTLGGKGVNVTATITTSLSAECTVTLPGDVSSNNGVTTHLGSYALQQALAIQLPSVSFEVSSLSFTTPPRTSDACAATASTSLHTANHATASLCSGRQPPHPRHPHHHRHRPRVQLRGTALAEITPAMALTTTQGANTGPREEPIQA
mmetsp:Transcript_62943/g.124389  ORF Transcript_62943/g.124389 Transcript_62943/m.124389 type:complete len:207 (+) Transcript_62943:346-966(+)